MARIRTIKPDLAQSRSIAKMPIDARYFFAIILCWLDDEGRLEWNTKRLAGEMYPHDDKVGASDMEKWLLSCCSAGVLMCYTNGGIRYVCAPNFLDHQVINRPTASKLPSVGDEGSLITHGELTDNSSPERKGKGKGKGNISSTEFDSFWTSFKEIYPKRTQMGWAAGLVKAKSKVTTLVAAEEVLAGAARYREYAIAEGKFGTEFVKQPATWLNQEEWTAEYAGGTNAKPPKVEMSDMEKLKQRTEFYKSELGYDDSKAESAAREALGL